MPNKKQTKKVGRPSKKDNGNSEVVSKLLAAFWRGANVSEACLYAGISRETYYDWTRNSQELSDSFTLAKNMVGERAKAVIVAAIDNGDINAAKWWLERRNRKEFGPKATDDYEEPPESDKVEAELQDSLTKNIATHYRLYLIRKREVLVNEQDRKNDQAIKDIDRLMRLSDKALADYAGLEIWATGNDYAGVRRKLIIRLGGDNYEDIFALAEETQARYDSMIKEENSDRETQ